MKKFWNIFISFFIILSGLYATSFTYAYYTSRVGVNNLSLNMGTWPKQEPQASEVVINELMINTSGPEDDVKPGGEWVELFNKTANEIDLNQWQLSDASDHNLPILAGNTNTGSTKIPGNGYLVIYRNGYSFSLNNGVETVSLFDASIPRRMIDTYSYSSNTEVDKTWGRLPNGSISWQKNLIPSLGGPNV